MARSGLALVFARLRLSTRGGRISLLPHVGSKDLVPDSISIRAASVGEDSVLKRAPKAGESISTLELLFPRIISSTSVTSSTWPSLSLSRHRPASYPPAFAVLLSTCYPLCSSALTYCTETATSRINHGCVLGIRLLATRQGRQDCYGDQLPVRVLGYLGTSAWTHQETTVSLDTL